MHGLSSSLCKAIQSVSRWKFVQLAFPHVMHCCASLLAERLHHKTVESFDNNETKLLYTLHWIILDAASECEDSDSSGETSGSYLHSIDTIQLFVFLFAPLLHSMTDCAFQTLKLENGLRLWQPLWAYGQPDVPCFLMPVKTKKVLLKANRTLIRVNFNTANIYIGKGTSTDDLFLGGPENSGSGENSPEVPSSPKAPLARMSDICTLSTTTAATSVEIICETCCEVLLNKNGFLSCKCGTRRASFISGNNESSASRLCPIVPIVEPMDDNFTADRLKSAISSGPRIFSPAADILSATHLDVAVLRCLFISQWAEDGVYWAVRYVHQRLLEINDEYQRNNCPRPRSRSLPLPHSIGATSSIDLLSKKMGGASVGDMDDIDPDRISRTGSSCGDYESYRIVGIEPPFKRHCKTRSMLLEEMNSQKQGSNFDETSDVELSHLEDGDASGDNLSRVSSSNGSVGGQIISRPSSAVDKTVDESNDSLDDDKDSTSSTSELSRRKSLPALRHMMKNFDEDDVSAISSPSSRGASKLNRGRAEVKRPMITVTQHTPDRSGFLANKSPTFKISTSSLTEAASCAGITHEGNMKRSMTDTEITYQQPEIFEEAPGSMHYILESGEMNYDIILQAIHTVASRKPSLRVCSFILNVVNCLMDLKIIEKMETLEKKCNDIPPSSKTNKKKTSKKRLVAEEDNKEAIVINKDVLDKNHVLGMETVLR